MHLAITEHVPATEDPDAVPGANPEVEMTGISARVVDSTLPVWSPLARFAFRIAFIYFCCFIFLYGNGTIFSPIPFLGHLVDDYSTWPINHLAEWSAQHVFHLTGLAAHWQNTGSGDAAVNWIQNGLFAVLAFVGGMVWTAVAALRGNRRREYQTLYAWLRFGLRLTLGYCMINYGLAKFFPLQMAPISIGILNEPVGQTSPMTLLWALIGFNPMYESICGAAEIIGGILFLFRRTALAGALVTSFVVTNVVLYNFFFDVPVKLFAGNLLLASLFVILPDVRPLFDFFWLHRAAAPAGVWVPPSSRSAFRIATLIVEIIFIAGFLIEMPIQMGIAWRHNQEAARTASPLIGAWHLDSTHPASGAFITGDGLPATDLYIDAVNRAFTRSTDLVLWRTGLDIDAKAHTVMVYPTGKDGMKYAWQMPDANHLTLSTTPPDKPKPDPKAKSAPKIDATPFTPLLMSFTRTPVPAHYPLLDRGFHFVNQWGLER